MPPKHDDMDVICAILRIFHLLPHPAASKFLEDLVMTSLEVSSKLPGARICNPYLSPLVKYFNVYPKEVFFSFNFFFKKKSLVTCYLC